MKFLMWIKSFNKEDFREIMSFLSVTSAFVYFFLITFLPIPVENQRFADVILGMMGTAILGRVFEYYFNKKNAD